MKSSTATGTTATGSAAGRYRGRFAPSPTGLLHVGSLVTALASWLDARAHGGTWLVRMEDLDAPRTRPGTARSILDTLARLGLESDEPVLWQSGRTDHYEAAFQRLHTAGVLYRCTCSRAESSGAYPGTCRDAGHGASVSGAWRLRMPRDADTSFDDRFQGRIAGSPESRSDPIVVRRDGIVSYQLAVVVDDIAQHVTDVVRGADLIDSTPWQRQIATLLGVAPPAHAHVPLVVEADGQKLAKSRHSVTVDFSHPGVELFRALMLLRQHPPEELVHKPVKSVLHWAQLHWNPGNIARVHTIELTGRDMR